MLPHILKGSINKGQRPSRNCHLSRRPKHFLLNGGTVIQCLRFFFIKRVLKIISTVLDRSPTKLN